MSFVLDEIMARHLPCVDAAHRAVDRDEPMAYQRSKMSQHYGAYVTPRQARQVWAYLTDKPRSRLRDIAGAMGVSVSVVRAARQLLRDAGYVDYEDGRAYTTTIVVPFRVARRRRSSVRA